MRCAVEVSNCPFDQLPKAGCWLTSTGYVLDSDDAARVAVLIALVKHGPLVHIRVVDEPCDCIMGFPKGKCPECDK